MGAAKVVKLLDRVERRSVFHFGSLQAVQVGLHAAEGGSKSRGLGDRETPAKFCLGHFVLIDQWEQEIQLIINEKKMRIWRVWHREAKGRGTSESYLNLMVKDGSSQ